MERDLATGDATNAELQAQLGGKEEWEERAGRTAEYKRVLEEQIRSAEWHLRCRQSAERQQLSREKLQQHARAPARGQRAESAQEVAKLQQLVHQQANAGAAWRETTCETARQVCAAYRRALEEDEPDERGRALAEEAIAAGDQMLSAAASEAGDDDPWRGAGSTPGTELPAVAVAAMWKMHARRQAQRVVALNRGGQERERPWLAQVEEWRKYRATVQAELRRMDRHAAVRARSEGQSTKQRDDRSSLELARVLIDVQRHEQTLSEMESYCAKMQHELGASNQDCEMMQARLSELEAALV